MNKTEEYIVKKLSTFTLNDIGDNFIRNPFNRKQYSFKLDNYSIQICKEEYSFLFKKECHYTISISLLHSMGNKTLFYFSIEKFLYDHFKRLYKDYTNWQKVQCIEKIFKEN